MATISYFINILLFCAITIEAGGDFYEKLGVDRRADLNAIKKAYRKKAKQLHPDKNPDDPEAEDKFKELGRIYHVLSDEKLRKKYDSCGEKCIDKDDDFGGMDPFASFFGDFGFGFGHHDRTPDTPRGGDVVMKLMVSLEELYVGQFVQLKRNKPTAKAASGTRRCNCRQEMVTKQLGPGRFQMMQQQVCDECPNIKFVNEERELEYEIEPGMVDGQEYRFIGEGEPHMDGEPGDLVVKIKAQPHSRFERKGNDLYTNVTISLQQALLGFELQFKHLDGHQVTVTRDKPIWPGARIRKKDEGMPHYDDNNEFGTLYITFDVAFPKEAFSDEDKQALKNVLKQDDVSKPYNGLRGY